MGDHREQFVDLEATADTATARAERVRASLREYGYAEPHEHAADDRWPDAIVDQAGPAWQAEWQGYATQPAMSWWRTVAVVTPQRDIDRVFAAMDGTGPSLCRSCGTAFDDDVFWDAFNAWDESGVEPTLTCAVCGTAAPMGDHDTTSSIVPGFVAVVTQDATPDVVREMLRVLRRDIGGRWAFVELND